MAEIRLFVQYDKFYIEVSDLEGLERERRIAKKIGAEIIAIEAICYEESSDKLLATKQIGQQWKNI